MSHGRPLQLRAPTPSVMYASAAFMAALYAAIGGGRFARRHIGPGQMRAMLHAPPELPPTPLRRGISRQCDRQIDRIEAKRPRRVASRFA